MADLAHELRTPVMGLLARIEAAQDGVFSDESANLAATHDEALRLSRLLDDISSLADAQRPGLLLERGAVDLAAVAEQQIAAAEAQLEQKGIEVVIELELVVVNGDARRLQQIMVNLLSNALRYTDQALTVRVFTEGESAILEEADTGIGIAELPLEARARSASGVVISRPGPRAGTDGTAIVQGLGRPWWPRLGGQRPRDRAPRCCSACLLGPKSLSLTHRFLTWRPPCCCKPLVSRFR